jgi:hypothetical protein
VRGGRKILQLGRKNSTNSSVKTDEQHEEAARPD